MWGGRLQEGHCITFLENVAVNMAQFDRCAEKPEAAPRHARFDNFGTHFHAKGMCIIIDWKRFINKYFASNFTEVGSHGSR